jgi:hypothetical protein
MQAFVLGVSNDLPESTKPVVAIVPQKNSEHLAMLDRSTSSAIENRPTQIT